MENSTSLKCFNFCELHGMMQCFCTGNDDCKICCKLRANDSACQPYSPSRNLPEGTSCVGGVCKEGMCDVTNPDFVTRLFRLFTDISIDEFGEWRPLPIHVRVWLNFLFSLFNNNWQFALCVRILSWLWCFWQPLCGFQWHSLYTAAL